MLQEVYNIINEFVQGVKTQLGSHIRYIILYGSYARGEERENSDIDILLLVDLQDKEIKKIQNDIYDLAFELASVVYNDSIKREALTKEQEREFLKFVKEDRHFRKYYDGIYILFNTGLRISEFTGLTKADIDFKGMKINVDHQLQRYNHIGYKIAEPKTESGVRQVPMTKEVAECFRRIIKLRAELKAEPVIDGYAGFLFIDKDGNPMVAMHWEKYFKHICEKYNKIYKVQMPKVTPHVFRYTFCSRMAAKRMNPKTLQYIMGHSDIGVTLNTYTHLGFEEASKEMQMVSNGQ